MGWFRTAAGKADFSPIALTWGLVNLTISSKNGPMRKLDLLYSILKP